MNVSIILSTEWWAVHVHIIWYNLLHIEDHKSLAGTAQFSRSYLICFKENKDTCTDRSSTSMLFRHEVLHVITFSIATRTTLPPSFKSLIKLTYTQSISIIRRRKEQNTQTSCDFMFILFQIKWCFSGMEYW